jgi:Family of unknown function (DUF6519)/Right handed beta helix region
MSGDYSRDSFDGLRDYAGVFLQQGRAVLDSDWNEMVEMFERRIRAGTVDTIGRAVVPRETPIGFEINPSGGGFGIGRGRFYLDGMLLECHGTANFDGTDPTRPDPVFDRARIAEDGPVGVLDEMIAPEAGDYVDYAQQPYWPTPEDLPGEGAYLAYLVAWQREITPTEAPALLEPALGGLDTTTRWQTVWQVRALAGIGEATCETPDGELAGWAELVAPSTARLTTGTIDVEDPEDPCLVPPTEGYTGIENQFYRIEIHQVGTPPDDGSPPSQGDWRFKFSRENASVRAAVTVIATDAESLTLSRIGRDEVLRFRPGDWVEITDDHRELNHRSGQMLRVADVDAETREVEFENAVEADLVPSGVGDDTLAARHTRLIRWDQAGVIRLDDGNEWVDLDADGSDGLIPVPPDDRAIVLESGITVSFSTADGAGTWREMDHWRFAARTAGTQIEILRAAPPDGVQRHYARLAIVVPGAEDVQDDCRVFWPPEVVAGEGCACTVCVTAEGHNSGALTIQVAIDQVEPAGGTVCLEAGLYMLSEPVRIADRIAIRLVGQGLGTILVYQGAGGAVQVETAIDIKLERFTILAAPTDNPDGAPLPVHGVAAVNTGLLAIRRLAVLIASANPEDRFDFGIALDGTQLATKIEECVLIGPHAIGARSSYGLDEDGDQQFVAFAELRVLDCILFAGRSAVRFDRAAINIAAARLSRNLVLSTDAGLRINWAEIPAAGLSIDNSTVVANGSAMILSAGTMRVQDCEISGSGEAGGGILLIPNILPETLTDGQIVGNTIFDIAGAGISIGGAHDTLFIKRNIIRDCGQGAILTTPDASVRHLAIDNNSIERVGAVAGAGFAAGIALTAVESGQIVGNSIRGVGDPGAAGQNAVGIGVQGVGSVDISSNVLSDIGEAQGVSVSVGILAMPPFIGLSIAANRVIGDLEANEAQTDWRAIRIGPLIANPDLDQGNVGAPANGFVTALPVYEPTALVYFNVAGATWAASGGRFAVLLPAARSQITATGNHARSARSLAGAMVSIVDPGTAGMSFAGNQCDLQSGGGLREVVILGATRVSASGNTITHNTDATSLRIVTGRAGAATPLGNITSAGISVHPGGLPPPFEPLNLTA